MFDPKQYDTRMRDPEGKRKKPPVEEHRQVPREARLRMRSEERFDEKRAEEPLPSREKGPRTRSAPRSWWHLAVVVLLVLIVWRFAAGDLGQGLVLLILGALGFFFAATRQRKTDPGNAPAPSPGYAPLPPRPGVPRPARRRRAKPRPTPTRKRKRSVGERISAWMMVSIITAVLSSVTGISKACKSDRAPRGPHQVEWPEPPRVRVAPAVPPVPPPPQTRRAVLDWPFHLPAGAPRRISGAVLFGAECTLPHVAISMTPASGRSVRSETDEHGVFVFDDVPDTRAVFEVRGAVHLGSHPPTVKRLNAGTHAGTVPIHPGHAFLLLLDEPASRPGRGEALLQVAATNGDASGTGSWTLDHEVALVTGLARDAFYDVLVQAHGDELAGLVERVAAGQQAVVALKPGTAVSGRVLRPVGDAADDVEIVLTHGRLRVTTTAGEDGSWRVPLLPPDSWWDVTARRGDPAAARRTTRRGVHAGDGTAVVLDLR